MSEGSVGAASRAQQYPSRPIKIVVPTSAGDGIADSPYRTLKELLEAMSATPGEITYPSQGVGSSAHLCVVVFNDLSRTQARPHRYKEREAGHRARDRGREGASPRGGAGSRAMEEDRSGGSRLMIGRRGPPLLRTHWQGAWPNIALLDGAVTNNLCDVAGARRRAQRTR
ncbi:tripartite tricarboxylate transporter substrate-binding protein [Variovorax sp. LjRoot178]|uniref:tripartite tricarboxylate transporter substrate-binding protein n=1 Tax=Variovorax sp. LjRoot178 TaxID=3342277 RepID=UPI003ECFC9C0